MFPNIPVPDTALTSFLARFMSATKEIVPGQSQTMRIRKTPHGSLYEIDDNNLGGKPGMVITQYVDGNGYSIGDWTEVINASTYILSDDTTYQSTPGIYICVSPVPPKIDPTTISNPSGLDIADFLTTLYSTYTQFDDVIYAPINPPVSSTLAYDTQDGKGQYWKLISSTCS